MKTWGDVAGKVYEIWEKAYLDLRRLTGASGADNSYFQGMMEARDKMNGPVSTSPNSKYKIVIDSANQVTNTGKQRGPKGLKTDRHEEKKDWVDYVTYTDEAIKATSMFTSSLSNLQSAFSTLNDADATWIDKLVATSRILETIEDTIMSTTKLINLLGDAEMLAAKKEEIATALGIKTKKKDSMANTEKAVTGAASSQAGIPYVGPLLAAAAVAGILALLAASTPKYASGGIIQGNSKYGDKLLARVNAGEAILNHRQQKRLLDIADGRADLIGGKWEFVIQGKTLKAVQRNFDNATARIAGQKGF